MKLSVIKKRRKKQNRNYAKNYAHLKNFQFKEGSNKIDADNFLGFVEMACKFRGKG